MRVPGSRVASPGVPTGRVTAFTSASGGVGAVGGGPDVAAAERAAAAANAQIGFAESAYFPTDAQRGGRLRGRERRQVAHTWPMRFWSVGGIVSETVLYDAGLRGAQSDQARAVYDASVASYRQTVLAAFQAVEDNLAALRILEQEARVHDAAVTFAEQSVTVITNQYKAGTVTYLNVITAQATELADKESAVSILGTRMADTVLLIEALGGGWTRPFSRRRATAAAARRLCIGRSSEASNAGPQRVREPSLAQ